LPPDVLQEILETRIESIIDYDKYRQIMVVEQQEKEKIAKLIG
jgi:hypothetical protein